MKAEYDFWWILLAAFCFLLGWGIGTNEERSLYKQIERCELELAKIVVGPR